MTQIRIPITRPVLGEEEARAVQLPLESEWIVQGPYVAEFERRFGEYVGAPHAVATSSCTTALHLAVAALGLGPGDEVVVPAFTWVSTANVVEYMGATPVFCDVDLRTFNIDPVRIEELITDRTVGIIPVHLFGLCADMDPILATASRHGLWVVEDAACAFGGWYGDRHAGTFGDAGCFSFHPRKSITTGEGGMITTLHADLDEKTRVLRDHGASRSDLARHAAEGGFLLAEYRDLGYNYRLTDIQGSLGCAQLDRADWVLGQRRRHAATYDALLDELDWLDGPAVPGGYTHGYQSYVALFRPDEPTPERVDSLHARRNALMSAVEREGVATRQGTHAPVLLDFYREKYGLRAEDFPNAWMADRLSLSLPLYPQMAADDPPAVVDALRRAFREA